MTEMAEAVRQGPDDDLLTLRLRWPNFDARVQEVKESSGPSWFGPHPRFLAAIYLGLSEPSTAKVASAIYRGKGRLRCAVAALAAENYRLKHGRWPDRPEQLVPEFLASWPMDPIDGQPLRWLPRPDGLLIYSIGPDGKDNEGDLGRDGSRREDIDVGFQLWNSGKRRQPPAEKESEDK
jgi:hypothetical protein